MNRVIVFFAAAAAALSVAAPASAMHPPENLRQIDKVVISDLTANAETISRWQSDNPNRAVPSVTWGQDNLARTGNLYPWYITDNRVWCLTVKAGDRRWWFGEGDTEPYTGTIKDMRQADSPCGKVLRRVDRNELAAPAPYTPFTQKQKDRYMSGKVKDMTAAVQVRREAAGKVPGRRWVRFNTRITGLDNTYLYFKSKKGRFCVAGTASPFTDRLHVTGSGYGSRVAHVTEDEVRDQGTFCGKVFTRKYRAEVRDGMKTEVSEVVTAADIHRVDNPDQKRAFTRRQLVQAGWDGSAGHKVFVTGSPKNGFCAAVTHPDSGLGKSKAVWMDSRRYRVNVGVLPERGICSKIDLGSPGL